jgi:hydroxyacylglutathione hydrolase
MNIEQFFLEGLGHQSHLIADEASGGAAVVDPRRDVDVYMEAAHRLGVRITHILETHVHNDYVTGARELAAQTGAIIVSSAGDPLHYPYQSVHEGDDIQAGTLRFQVMETPGHTPHHVSYALYEQDSKEPTALFSGGSLLTGNAGRTDLLGDVWTLTLTRQQYHTLRRLLEALPGQVRVYPTHGAGSFCMASATTPAHSTTIAQERLISPAVLAKDEVDFVKRQLAGYIAYPAYYKYMHDINVEGPSILGRLPEPPPLRPHEVQSRLEHGIVLVDGRSRYAFAREHIPGALNIELDSSFSTYVGWLLPFNQPIMLLIEDEEGRREAVVQLIRIGYEQFEGYLEGGLAEWKAAAMPTEEFELIDVDTLYRRWQNHTPMTIIDVRRDEEWRQGHIPHAQHLHLAELPQRIDDVPHDGPVALICRTGHRAEIAASILAATGRKVIAVGQGGMADWMERGLPYETEEPPQIDLSRLPEQVTHAHP